MIDELKLNEASAKAVRAQNLLDNDLVIEAHDKIEAALIAGWIASEARDTDGREKLWHRIHANRAHKGVFEAIVRDGKMAQAQLKQFSDAAEHKRLWQR
jgi:hypothetical protein